MRAKVIAILWALAVICLTICDGGRDFADEADSDSYEHLDNDQVGGLMPGDDTWIVVDPNWKIVADPDWRGWQSERCVICATVRSRHLAWE